MIKKAEAQHNHSTKMQPWWLYFCIALLIFNNTVISISIKCEKLNDTQNLLYECGNKFNRDQIKITILPTNEQLEIICSEYDKPDYIDIIKEINTTSTFERLVIQQCPFPISPFFELSLISNIHLVKNISFQSSRESSSHFNSYIFKKLNFLKILHLKNNNIFTLPEKIFNNLHNLEELNLSGNQLENLPVKLFESLTKFRRLNLQSNNFTNLNENILRYAPTLTYLNLCDNHLNYIPTSLFSFSSNITILELGKNNITHLENGAFDNLQYLEELNLSENKLTSLPGNLFDKNWNLKVLDLNGNSLKMLPDSIFRYTRNMEKLDIGNNYLGSLTEHVFDHSTKLTTLRLNGNNLTSIHRNAFHHLISLIELNLSKNELKVLDSRTFLDLHSLETIDLSYNQLRLEEAKLGELSPFLACLNLQNIIFNHNSLTRVFADWRILFNNLRELDLSFNKLESLTTDDFIFNASNATINFGNNPIKVINLDNLEEKVLPPCSRSHFYIKNYNQKPTHYNNFNLENSRIKCDCHALSLAKYFRKKFDPSAYKLMNLSANGVYCDSPDTMITTKNISLDKVNWSELRCSIKELYPEEAHKCPENCRCHYRLVDRANIVNCTNSNVDRLPEQVPIVNNSKTELFFSRNRIKSLAGLSELIKRVENITFIYLSNNEIENIDDLEIPKTLEVLKLHNNRISKIKEHTINLFRSTESLRNLSLHENPWECNCEAQYFQKFLRFHRPTLWINDYTKIKCKTTNAAVVHTWEEELCKSIFVTISIYLAVIGLTCIPTIIVYYKFKRRIQIWMFTNKICLWLVTEKEIDKDKPYDAFVSFSHKDQDFVDQYLIPELEQNGEYKFKLCIHYRDFKVGQFIPSQIINSVENSKRTIIILTPNFLQSIWARMEFRMAYLQAIKERCARVIVILLEEVNQEMLDPELKAYVMLNTYVKWGDSLFWEKLRYALPHPQIKSKRNRRLESRNIYQEIELKEITECQKN